MEKEADVVLLDEDAVGEATRRGEGAGFDGENATGRIFFFTSFLSVLVATLPANGFTGTLGRSGSADLRLCTADPADLGIVDPPTTATRFALAILLFVLLCLEIDEVASFGNAVLLLLRSNEDVCFDAGGPDF